MHEAFGQQRHHTRVTVKGTVADHTAFTPIEIENGGEREINPTGAQLRTQHVARRRGRIGGAQRAAARHGLGALAIVHPHLAESAHGRQVGKAIGAKALHAAALMVHADQQIVTHGLDTAGQLQQLRAVFPVAGKQDHATGQRMGQAAAVGGGQLCACHVEDEGGVFGHRVSNIRLLLQT
ncbi:hypothetical protein D3C71_1051570 [compost metagenome]